MSWWRGIASALRPRILRRSQDEADLEDEIQFDLSEEARLRAGRGESLESAELSARRDFGNVALVKEATREAWGWTAVGNLVSDVRYACRTLRKSPGFTLVAVASLAIGIGVNTSIFSVLNAMLIRPLPVSRPDRLQLVMWSGEPAVPMASMNGYATELYSPTAWSSFSYPMYERLSQSVPQFSELTGFADGQFTIVARGASHSTGALFVTGNFFTALGVQALAGRTLNADDNLPGSPAVAVLSYSYWERYYNLDPTVIGQQVLANRQPVTIVGVMPQPFQGLTPGRSYGMFAPIARVDILGPKSYSLDKEDAWWVQIVGRLRDDVPANQARAALQVVLERENERFGPTGKQKRDPWRAVVAPGHIGLPLLRQQASRPLIMLSCILGLVLLIACVNLANLLVARGTARRREIGVRLALGAGRFRLIRQLLVESFLLAGLGAALGIVLASPLSKGIVGMVRGAYPLALDTGIDGRVLLFTVAVALATALVFGLAPAFCATRVDLMPGLKDGAGGSAGTRRSRFSRTLVAGQVAVSAVLVAAALLFVRTLIKLSSVDPGFDAGSVVIFAVNGAQAGYEGERLAALYEQIRMRLAAIPGVEAATLSSLPLIAESVDQSYVTVTGYKPDTGRPAQAHILTVGNRFFETMRIPILLGRPLRESDGPRAPKAAVVNETFARRFLSSRNPIGATFSLGAEGPLKPEALIEVVGVSRDAKYESLRHAIPATVYVPLFQERGVLGGVTFEVRTSLARPGMAAAIRRAVAAGDRGLPLENMRTQKEQIRLSLGLARLFAQLVGSLAVLAALLAAIGIYGLMSYTVARRTPEIAIRLALGASESQILRLVLRDSLRLVVIGLAVGVPVALALARLVRGALFGIGPSDPVSFVAAGTLMLAVAGVAAAIPARRAAAVDATAALRCE